MLKRVIVIVSVLIFFSLLVFCIYNLFTVSYVNYLPRTTLYKDSNLGFSFEIPKGYYVRDCGTDGEKSSIEICVNRAQDFPEECKDDPYCMSRREFLDEKKKLEGGINFPNFQSLWATEVTRKFIKREDVNVYHEITFAAWDTCDMSFRHNIVFPFDGGVVKIYIRGDSDSMRFKLPKYTTKIQEVADGNLPCWNELGYGALYEDLVDENASVDAEIKSWFDAATIVIDSLSFKN